MEGAIENILPNTNHRWCKWHVLRCAKEKLGPIYGKKSGFKHEFHEIINDIICVTEFEGKWAELIDKYNLKDNPYLENLYSKRTMWAKPYFSSVFCAGMTSTQRSESANHLLKQYIPRSSPMHLFVKQYNKLLQSRTTDEGRQQHMTKMKCRRLNGGFPLEADAAKIYTKGVFIKFEEELYQAASFIVSNCISNMEFEVTRARPDYLPEYEMRRYKVAIRDGGDFIDCDCGYFQHSGMLCCHSIKVLIRNDILKIPSKNIVKRWTKMAKELQSSNLAVPHASTQPDDASYRQNILYIAALETVKDTSLSCLTRH
ncbi:protein FAR1-RELATED SEQUENCE 5-like [Triticum dicoccoides]|uniref:protein FAR1-RELATED SEQUENCE 5-like n=1 Tax=Triticum dicoccoides TaxID=85692 RepID=UPI0018916D68|nr:protein FAR1-RELATED SEQUENCE 5-like [Triticum dicoccoides]